MAEGTILDVIDEAKSAAIITEPGDTESYAFTHMLVRATLYDALDRIGARGCSNASALRSSN